MVDEDRIMGSLRSKTIIFSVLLAIVGTLELNIHLLQDMLGDYYGISYVGIAIAVAVLRAVTTKPLRDK